jgi:pimeloyl-ACP methyl ester carboxylesterase
MRKNSPQSVMVLVHGSWGGGWVWANLVDQSALVRSKILTPTLTGMGERAHLLHEHLDAATHVADIVELIEFEDLRNVVLVGHSYGALVATAAACSIPDRIASLVVLDGFLARPGRPLFDLHPELRELMSGLCPPDTPWKIMPPPAETLGFSPSVAAWFDCRSRPMSMATHGAALACDFAHLSAIERHYVRCKQFPMFETTSRAAQEEGWRLWEIDAGHAPMITAPTQLASILQQIADAR